MADLKLNDLRRYAVLNGTTITFRDGAGREARIASSGVAEIPGINGQPAFGVSELLAAAEQFELSGKGAARRLSRAAMLELVVKAAPAAAAHHEKEE